MITAQELRVKMAHAEEVKKYYEEQKYNRFVEITISKRVEDKANQGEHNAAFDLHKSELDGVRLAAMVENYGYSVSFANDVLEVRW